MTLTRRPQVQFAEEDLEQARRQLVLYGRDGLPVLSRDGQLRGWLTRADLLRALATQLSSSEERIEDGAAAADFALPDPAAAAHMPSTPLRGCGRSDVELTAGERVIGLAPADDGVGSPAR